MIDWKRINELRSEIGDTDFLEVVEMFLDEADDVSATLEQSPDFCVLENRLHFLKGSALNLGLSELAELCQRGEKTAATGNAATVDLVTIIQCYRASKARLLASLGHPQAA